MRKGIDCNGKEWEEIPISVFMSDLSSLQFGLLTALFPVKIKDSNKDVLWLCQCSCGNIVVRKACSLQNGTTNSCGCERYKKVKKTKLEKHKQNIGKRFNKLVVLDVIDAPPELKDRRAYYKCLCDCGKTIIARSTDIISGKTMSCGCAKRDAEARKREDLTGKRFGKLTVTGFAYIKNQSSYWNCTCDCGSSVIESIGLLNSGHVLSCGCIKSIGELNIISLLIKSKIEYLHDKRYFKDLVSDKGTPLRYDFILFDENHTPIRLIEFDGPQHNDNGKFFGVDSFERLQKHDTMKNQYALSHNIPLVRIPYSKRDTMTIEDLLGDKYLIKGDI
jgi:hypothetical protein